MINGNRIELYSGIATSERLTRAQVRGSASAVAVLACFALAWTSWGLSVGLPAPITYSIVAVAVLGFLVLLGGAIVMYRQAQFVPSGEDTAARVNGIGRRFGAIAAAEIVGLVIISRILGATGNDRFIAAAVCLGVGIHFFPLRRLFRAPIYTLTGAVLCAFALATVPLAILTGQTALWTTLPALGAALTLFTTSALLLHAQHLWRVQAPVLAVWIRPPASGPGQ